MLWVKRTQLKGSAVKYFNSSWGFKSVPIYLLVTKHIVKYLRDKVRPKCDTFLFKYCCAYMYELFPEKSFECIEVASCNSPLPTKLAIYSKHSTAQVINQYYSKHIKNTCLGYSHIQCICNVIYGNCYHNKQVMNTWFIRRFYHFEWFHGTCRFRLTI